MRRLATAMLFALPLAGCGKAALPQDPVERAGLCAAATRLAMSGGSADGETGPAPFDRLNAVAHYYLLAGVRDDGLWDVASPMEARTFAGQAAETVTGAKAISRQCARTYPATERAPVALPDDDLVTLAGCYQLAAHMGDYYLEGGAGQGYPEAVDVGLLMLTVQDRFESHPARGRLTSQTEIETLMRRGMNALVQAGPPHETLKACQARFATALG